MGSGGEGDREDDGHKWLDRALRDSGHASTEWLVGDFWRRPKWPLIAVLLFVCGGMGAAFFWFSAHYHACRAAGRADCEPYWVIPFVEAPEVAEHKAAAEAAAAIDRLYDEAEDHARVMEFRAALGPLNRYIAARPRDGAAFAFRGEVERTIGDPGSALRDYDRAAQLGYESNAQRRLQALALAELGQIDAAIEKLDAVLATDPALYAAYCRRGALRLAKGDVVGAAADFDFAAELPDRPNRSVEAAYCAGAVEMATGNMLGAVDRIGTAISENPYSIEAHRWMLLASGQGLKPGEPEIDATFMHVEASDGHAKDYTGKELLRFITGGTTAAAIMAFVDIPADYGHRENLTKAAFYLGAFVLRAGAAEDARRYFQRVVDEGMPYYVEYGLAKLELAKLELTKLPRSE